LGVEALGHEEAVEGHVISAVAQIVIYGPCFIGHSVFQDQ
jgi:hypothetical protein